MIALVLLFASSVLGITVDRTVCLALCSFVLTLHVEAAADNEKVVLAVEAEDSEYARYSELPLDAKTFPTVKVRYANVPRGTYTLTATLWKHDGKSWIAGVDTKTLTVKGDE